MEIKLLDKNNKNLKLIFCKWDKFDDEWEISGSPKNNTNRSTFYNSSGIKESLWFNESKFKDG